METQTDPSQFTFVLDWSYSMGGNTIKLAKEALELYIRGLPPRCEFNILCFGCDHKFMMSSYQTYSDKSLKEAIRIINGIDANMGGTELYSWLQTLFSSSHKNNSLQNHVVLLTDGWVSNAESWYELIKENSDDFTLNTFGVGSGASTDLVVNCAKAGGGKYYLIDDSCSTLKKDVINCLSSSFESKIMILDTGIGTKGKRLYEYPKLKEEKWSMAHGSYFTYYRIFDPRGKPLRGSISFDVQEKKNGKVNDIFLDMRDDVKMIDGDFIFKMFCDKYIRESDKIELGRDTIVEMSLKFQIASGFTSMIIVDSKNLVKQYKKAIAEEKKKTNSFDFSSVPKISGSGADRSMWITVRDTNENRFQIYCSKSNTVEELINEIAWKSGEDPGRLRALFRGMPLKSSGKTLEAAGIRSNCVIHWIPIVTGGGSYLNVKFKSEIDLDRLVGMQSYDGSWGSGMKQFGDFYLEHPIKKLPSEVRDLLVEDKVESILYTWLALKIIDEYFSDQKDELELVIRKGKDYIFVITNGHLEYKDINESIYFM